MIGFDIIPLKQLLNSGKSYIDRINNKFIKKIKITLTLQINFLILMNVM